MIAGIGGDYRGRAVASKFEGIGRGLDVQGFFFVTVSGGRITLIDSNMMPLGAGTYWRNAVARRSSWNFCLFRAAISAKGHKDFIHQEHEVHEEKKAKTSCSLVSFRGQSSSCASSSLSGSTQSALSYLRLIATEAIILRHEDLHQDWR